MIIVAKILWKLEIKYPCSIKLIIIFWKNITLIIPLEPDLGYCCFHTDIYIDWNPWSVEIWLTSVRGLLWLIGKRNGNYCLQLAGVQLLIFPKVLEIRYDAQSAFIVNSLGKIKNLWMIVFYLKFWSLMFWLFSANIPSQTKSK